MFFNPSKILFSGFLQRKGNFVRGQNNSKYCDWGPLNELSSVANKVIFAVMWKIHFRLRATATLNFLICRRRTFLWRYGKYAWVSYQSLDQVVLEVSHAFILLGKLILKLQLFSFVIVSLQIIITDSWIHAQKFLEQFWFGFNHAKPWTIQPQNKANRL